MDPVPEVIFRALSMEPVPLEDGDAVLVLGLEPHPGADTLAPARVDVVEPWAMAVQAWARVGHACDTDEDGVAAAAYRLVLVRPERQVDGRRARLARAVRAAVPGGWILAALPTREGGKRLPDELEALGAEVLSSDSKARCRYVWAQRPEGPLPAVDAAIAEDAPRAALDGLWSRPGLFSWDAPDPGTRLLAEALPDRLGERIAEAGCGPGWLASRIVAVPGRCTQMALIEADRRALDLAVANLAGDHGVQITAHHVDATEPWPVRHLDAIVTNPPFHRHGAHDVGLTEAFLARAVNALIPGGRMFAVAQRTVPLARMMGDKLVRVEEIAAGGGFRVLRGTRPQG